MSAVSPPHDVPPPPARGRLIDAPLTDTVAPDSFPPSTGDDVVVRRFRQLSNNVISLL